jgi:deazaflavin-dependent oxidoreductase (nitroreductase family)
MVKERLVRWLQTRLINPMVVRHAGDTANRYALLETTGRKTGMARQTPVGNGLHGDEFWIVSEHGRNAYYVRNLEANPRVRIRVDGSWRAGNAHPIPDDDPVARLKELDPRTAAEIKRMGSQLLSVRVDLDPTTGESEAEIRP